MTIAGNYEKGIKGGFDESKRLIMGFVRKGIPWADGDENMKEWARFTQMRRAFDTLIGDASPNNGFKPVGTGVANDFTLKGGDGTLNGAGRMYVKGMGCFLLSDIIYKNAGASADQLSIFPVISFITTTTIANDTLQDSAANYITNELVGRTITPDVKQPGATATVIANTANTIQVGVNLATLGTGIAVGAHYRVELPAPPGGGTRTDDIYLNASIAENSTDPSIEHNLGTTMVLQYFGQITHTIYVKQGGGVVVTNYIDIDGLEHFLTKIGTITRIAGQAVLNAPDVVDLRATSGSLTAFLPKAGGTMTGNVQLNGSNVVMLGAETVDGRDVSVDGAKLDTIDWTPTGVAGKLALISWPFQGTDLIGVATSTVNVSRYLKNRIAGATTSTKGVFTDPPHNKVVIKNTATSDDYLVGEDPLKGRLTYAAQTLTGTFTFTFGSVNVVGLATQFTTQCQIGDIIRGADNNWYTIATITNDLALTLVETYLGPNASGVANVPRQRWILSLISAPAGVETAHTPAAPIDISWFWHEVFDESTRPVVNPLFGIPSDQVAAEVPDASTTQPGKVRLALADGTDSNAGRATQASDVRLGRIKAELGGAGQTGLEPILNFIQGTGVTIAITQSGGKINISISNSAPGGGGLGLGGANPAPVSSTGPLPGTSSNASHDDHVHKLGTEYAIRTDMRNQNTSGTFQSNGPLGFTPRFCIAMAFINTSGGNVSSFGVANGVAQGSLNFSGGGHAFNGAALLSTATDNNVWAVNQFTAAGVQAPHTNGAGTANGTIITVGDIV